MPDVYQGGGLEGLGGIGIIRAGQPTEYTQAPQGLGGGNLVDQAISGRSNFENRRRALIQQLPYANRRQGAAIAAELHAIDQNEHQLNFDANQRRVMAHTDALEADRKWKMDRETEIDEHGAAMIQGLGQLRGALRNGRITEDQYHEGLLNLGQKYPYAMRHPEAAKRYEFDISEADKMRDFAQRRDIAESVKLASKYGVQPKVNETTGLPDLEATRAEVVKSPKFSQEQIHGMNVEMMQKYGVGTGVSSLFNPVAPHTSPDEGKSIDLPFRDPKTGTVGKTTIPMPLFNTMKSDFQDRYFALVPQQTQADPRSELAQRALNDPNATEAHKEAARKILGINPDASE
jgi:hypothetical protein